LIGVTSKSDASLCGGGHLSVWIHKIWIEG
jgi:hypothetical protein